MSDILTSHSSCVFDDRFANDNLVDFLTKLTRFGIDQCLHFVHLIVNKQRSLENFSTPDDKIPNYPDKRIHLNLLLWEIQSLQNDFYNILLLISSSSNDQNIQLLFLKIQKYLSTFVQINLRFKSFDLPPAKEIQTDNKLELPLVKCDRSLSTTSSFNNIPQIIISSSFYSNDDINHNIDIGKSWKFGSIIHTRFEMSFIASNSHTIICYNNQNNFLHFILLTGQFQGNIKWKYEPILDIVWCAFIDRYLAVTRDSIFTIQYDRTKLSSNKPIIINKVMDLNKFNSARIACNENNILIYTIHQKSSSIQVYDEQFNRKRIFDSAIEKQLSINSSSFCCTNTLIALTEKEDVLISYIPYITPKKISLLLFDIDTLELRYTIDLNNCSDIYTMKCLAQLNIFFVLSYEKNLWIIKLDSNETIQMATKPFYTNQTEMCIVNNRDLLLINVNAGYAIQLIQYRQIKQ